MKALPSVLVDNTAGSHAADVEGCGLPDKPCLTIDYGVQCALAATSGDEVAEVHVQGPGPYNGTSGDGRGIVIPNKLAQNLGNISNLQLVQRVSRRLCSPRMAKMAFPWMWAMEQKVAPFKWAGALPRRLWLTD